MHRERTHLAARVNRVAAAVERRGVMATYELHDHLLANRRSRRLHAKGAEPIDELQRVLVDRLDKDGYATIPFPELFHDEDVWQAVAERGASFVADTERGLELETSGLGSALRRRGGKEFVVRAYSFDGVTLGVDDPWLRACLSQRLLGVANAYLRMWSKLSYVDLWYTAPQDESTERAASQLWHQDFDDRHLMKAFLYLVDVDDAAGPFEYVPGSQAGGRYEDTWSWSPLGTHRIPEDEVHSRVGREAIETFTGPRGTLVLCNTSGLHRGGFATGKPRVLATATYCSPASLAALSLRNYRVDPSVLAALPLAARFAVS